MASDPEIRKELLRYLLMQVKQERLDVGRAKEFIKAIVEPERERDEPFAVVGIACRFPGARDKEEFWSNLVEGRESIGAFPPIRLEDLQRVEGGAVSTVKGGYLDRIDLFDPEYFGLPPQVARQIDPYHRNLVEVLVETMEDAGYAKSELDGTNVGVFVGNDHTHRLRVSYLPFLSEADFSAMTGSWSGILASRLSYLLNLRGPAVVVDTGCSSGLVALDAAMKSIRQGDCDTAFVAAINLLLAPTGLGDETESGDCRVRAFDEAANGTVWSEGVAGVYLKPLSRAVADGDHVYGVVLGGAVNNDGRSNGLTAPNARAQDRLLVSAWRRAGVEPESISYIEAHGTGTPLGDPIEIKGLTSAFRAFTGRRQFCALGSVKTNIGHTVGAAGLASLIKVLLSLQRGAIPPSLHFDAPNRFFDLAESPVYVCDRLTEWTAAGTPRRAGVSSFSLSGTNCHVVLEEAPPLPGRPDPGRGPYLYPISARNEELLAGTAARHLEFLDGHPEYRIDDVCFTMQAGREHQPVRAVVLCDGRDSLRDGLERLLGRRPAGEGAAVVREPRGTPPRFRLLAEAVDDFLAGGAHPFAGLRRDADVRRVPLPPQLFHRVRLWDESVRPRNDAGPAAGPGDDVESILAQPSCLHGEEDASPSRKVIARVWSDVLGYPMLHGTDDFFGLGGDSVASLKITQMLNAEFDLEISASALLAKPVFDDFADAVAGEFGLSDARVLAGSRGRRPAETAEERAVEEYELPLTGSQRSMFLSSRLHEDSTAYNVTGLTIGRGPQDTAVLEKGLRALVRRHDSLRSTFHMVHGEPFQRVHADVPVTVEHRRLGAPGDGETHEDRAREQMKEFVRPFRLDEAPLFRVGCFEFDDGATCVAIDMHHIITDGTSMGIVFRDLAAASRGEALAPLPRSYRSAIRELLERQNGANLLPHRNYWVSRFEDGVPTLRLTTDRQRSDVATRTGATFFTAVDARTLEAAKRYAREHDLTLYMFLLGVFQQLLSRLSGQDDVVIGAPVMGRPDLAYQDLVGMFVNTLPIRIAAGPGTGVGAYFTALKSTVLDAFEHQDYPLESLIEELGPRHEPGRRPLFDVCFVHQNTDMGLEHDDARVITFDDGSAKYDITLSTRESGGELLVEWEYSTALFREETVRLFAERHLTLLRSVLAAGDHDELGALRLMPEREAELIRRYATTPAPPLESESVVGLFERHVAADPGRTALIMDDDRLSYGELNSRANRVARGLLRLGAEPGTPIALFTDRSFDMIVAILGVLKAGCFYVPLNTEFPAERLRMIADDSGAAILLSAPARMERAARLATDRLRVVDLSACMELAEDDTDPAVPTGGDDEIYIMYTSGTTGVPKGSTIRHKSVLRVVRRSVFYEADPSDVFLLMSDYSFDGSVYDMFGALTNGAALVILEKAAVLDLDRLASAIERHGVTTFFITAAMFNALIDHAPGSLGGIRRMIFGGEMASPVHVRRAFDLLGPGRIANGYGPTESTVFAAVHNFDDFDENDAVPIGRPINDTSLWVLDDRLEPQPIGVGGELFIGGEGLADGYLNRPELDAERFVQSPAVPGRILYRTGDLVTLKSNGRFYYTGRIDRQIKLRGHRIELAEIIHVAMAEPYVRWAHAGVHVTEAGGKSLCLWVRYEEDAGTAEPRLRAALARRLPSYMVPAFVVETATVPWTANGKLDETALPGPDLSAGASAAAPVTELQRRIAAAWSDVLGAAVEDIDANFFALGGDSIKAIQVVSRLKAHGVHAQVADLLEAQSIRSLEEKASGAAGPAETPEYDQAPLTGPVVPGPIQHAFLGDAANRVRLFNQSLLVTTGGPCPPERLMRGMERLARHHDLLRVAMDEQGGLHLRDVDAPSLIHAEEAPEGLSDAEMTEYVTALQAKVDVGGGPAVALGAGLGQDGRTFAIAIHHLAVDVVSWMILLEDLLTCVADPDADLPAKTMPFPEWTAALKRHAEGGGFRSQLPYWTDLAENTGEDLFDTVKVARGETDADVVRIEETDGFSLLDAAREVHGAEPAETLLTVVARAVATMTGRDRILFDLEGHGRESFAGDHDLSRTVGWFTSTFPHLVQVEDRVDDTVNSVRRSFERLPAKGFGFGPLLRFDPALGDDANVLGRLRPQIGFNYLGEQDGFGDITVTHLPADITTGEGYRTPYVLDVIASRGRDVVVIEVRRPKDWRGRGDRDIAAHIEAAFHEVREAVRATGRRGFRTSPSISHDVLEDILVDVAGELQVEEGSQA
ncbi:non-ribosomal peptide synthetase [Spirillospora albida]|uniref:non-ribosomal peptide synthetase n=1 Tax=Spirillospora albida TaxID=58123 RepID=UPI0004BFD945|nr:non-ribosomal peptide synthetase [Spirillospora albida]